MPDPLVHTKSTLYAAVLAGCVIAFLSFGFSASFGVFLNPMSTELGWGREVFSLSVAVQALCWGFAQPVAGMAADRYGTARVLAFGAILRPVVSSYAGPSSTPKCSCYPELSSVSVLAHVRSQLSS